MVGGGGGGGGGSESCDANLGKISLTIHVSTKINSCMLGVIFHGNFFLSSLNFFQN